MFPFSAIPARNLNAGLRAGKSITRRIFPFVVLAGSYLSCPLALASTPIVPTNGELVFEGGKVVDPGIISIVSTSGQKLYELWLHPDRDVATNVDVLELTLSRAGTRDPDNNLLNPGWSEFSLGISRL
jgi:hypothetical protein